MKTIEEIEKECRDLFDANFPDADEKCWFRFLSEYLKWEYKKAFLNHEKSKCYEIH